MLCQLSYTHHCSNGARVTLSPAPPQATGVDAPMARQKGLEPLTHGLEGRCSVHLSYWREKIGASRFERPTPCSQGRCADQAAPRPEDPID